MLEIEIMNLLSDGVVQVITTRKGLLDRMEDKITGGEGITALTGQESVLKII